MSERLPATPRPPAAALAILAVLALAGCASSPMRTASTAAVASRATALAEAPAWSLTGRVAVSDGKDGGSGRIDWRQDGDDYVIEIRAPVSKQTWRLVMRDGELVLEGARREPVRGADAEALLAEEVGWRLPIDEMQHWVRGGTAHPDAHVTLDERGLPREIVEGGWRVEYKAFDDAQSPPLPTRIFAERAPYTVRLAVAEWRRE